jgi:hypothetical protein
MGNRLIFVLPVAIILFGTWIVMEVVIICDSRLI